MTPDAVPEVASGSRPRWLLPAIAAVLVVIAAVVTVVVFAVKGGNGPGDQFERAAKAFHDVYTPASKDMTEKLKLAAGGGFGDTSYTEATSDARKLGDAFDAYGKAVRAIQVPAGAKPAAEELGKATDAGKLIMVNSAAFFSAAQMQATLDQYRPQVEALVAKAEESLRAALAS